MQYDSIADEFEAHGQTTVAFRPARAASTRAWINVAYPSTLRYSHTIDTARPEMGVSGAFVGALLRFGASAPRIRACMRLTALAHSGQRVVERTSTRTNRVAFGLNGRAFRPS